jgi:hypothetical protein
MRQSKRICWENAKLLRTSETLAVTTISARSYETPGSDILTDAIVLWCKQEFKAS